MKEKLGTKNERLWSCLFMTRKRGFYKVFNGQLYLSFFLFYGIQSKSLLDKNSQILRLTYSSAFFLSAQFNSIILRKTISRIILKILPERK